MRFRDRIYGEVVINDPLILEIVKTPTFRRLKKVNQYGGVNLVYPEYQVSRYEHSLGVWWVLKSLNAPPEIQVSGLLHDIGHRAFSHMVDMALGNKNEDFHEGIGPNLPKNDEIRKVLKRYKIKIVEADGSPEIKRDSMDIGADRLDYAIRDYYAAIGKYTLFGNRVIKHIKLKNREIVFTNRNVAREYALTGLKAMWKAIYEPKVAIIYQSLVEMIRIGFDDGWLTKKDLRGDDKHVFGIIKKNGGKFPELFLKVFEVPFKVAAVGKSEKYDFKHVKLRSRYFDPVVELNGKFRRLSRIDKIFVKALKENRKVFEKRKKGVYLKVRFIKKGRVAQR